MTPDLERNNKAAPQVAKVLLLDANTHEASRDPDTIIANCSRHLREHGLIRYEQLLCRGALLANCGFEAASVTTEEAKILEEEKTNRFKQRQVIPGPFIRDKKLIY